RYNNVYPLVVVTDPALKGRTAGQVPRCSLDIFLGSFKQVGRAAAREWACRGVHDHTRRSTGRSQKADSLAEEKSDWGSFSSSGQPASSAELLQKDNHFKGILDSKEEPGSMLNKISALELADATLHQVSVSTMTILKGTAELFVTATLPSSSPELNIGKHSTDILGAEPRSTNSGLGGGTGIAGSVNGSLSASVSGISIELIDQLHMADLDQAHAKDTNISWPDKLTQRRGLKHLLKVKDQDQTTAVKVDDKGGSVNISELISRAKEAGKVADGLCVGSKDPRSFAVLLDEIDSVDEYACGSHSFEGKERECDCPTCITYDAVDAFSDSGESGSSFDSDLLDGDHPQTFFLSRSEEDSD
ncbi:hypothetical protein FOL47_001264, partial [Perkinsus chesapeaki]